MRQVEATGDGGRGGQAGGKSTVVRVRVRVRVRVS